MEGSSASGACVFVCVIFSVVIRCCHTLITACLLAQLQTVNTLCLVLTCLLYTQTLTSITHVHFVSQEHSLMGDLRAAVARALSGLDMFALLINTSHTCTTK